MSKRKIVIIFSLLICSTFLISWGVTGHRTIGQIAANHLTPKAQADVQALLGTQTLADVATWADEVRPQPAYRHTAPWHFLNLPLGLSHSEFVAKVESLPEENVYSALNMCLRTLASTDSSRESRIEALKFIVHFVGDLHQPMHISRAEDKGGNTIQLNYNGQGTNLHAVWDSKLLDQQGLDYTKLAIQDDHATPAQIKQWQSDPVLTWIWESYQASSRLYAEVDSMSGRSIGDDYYKAHIAIVNERIEQAGIRLAGLLNNAFAHMAPIPPAPIGTAAVASGAAAVASGTAGDTTICDVVSDIKVFESSGMVLLNLGGSYPNQKMTVVIKGEDKAKFPVSPDVAFSGKRICVKGVVTEYKGKPEIMVTDPSQITAQ